jgi:NodT family efflux transporter outer membrane factor (OMF) lipoprotein
LNPMRLFPRLKIAGAAGLVACFAACQAACTAGPDYSRPAAPPAAEFKELRGWKPSTPADGIDRGAWWSVYKDPVLDGLEHQVAVQNQTLKGLEAAYRQSLAVVLEARAGYFPTVSAGPTIGNRQTSSPVAFSSNGIPVSGGTSNISNYSVQASASWAPDFWGSVRRQVESDAAAAQANAAAYANGLLSAQAQLATTYFQLRYEESLGQMLQETIAGYQRSLDITSNQYAVGVAARGDVITAQAQLQAAQSQAVAVGVQRAQYEHAIAVLVGKAPADLSIGQGNLAAHVPIVPVDMPSALLERRPDIAQAERTMQTQSALIGVQAATYFPNITLSSSYSVLGSALSTLELTPTRVWSYSVGASELLIDGGLRSAEIDAARAAYEQSIASYRQTVLTAFQQVEDSLASLRILEQQAVIQDQALQSARQAVQIAVNGYRAGTQAYTAVVTAQATALTDEESALQIQQSRLMASATLIQALGGGWDASMLPTLDATKKGKAPIANSSPRAQ